MVTMNEGFFEEVDVAIRLVRRRKRKALGELPHLRDLKVVQDRLQDPVELVSPTYIGGILESLIKETIATLEPISDEDSNDPDWRDYILLHDYFILGERWKTVADRLSLSRTRFFEVISLAVEALALALIEEQPTVDDAPGMAPVIRHNLPRPMYQFVRRSDGQGQDLVEKAIQGLMRRPWVVSIRGYPGAGKTTLALEVAQRCVEKAYFDAIIWIAARTEREGYVTSLETICNTIGQVLGDRRVVAAEGLPEKRALAIKNLSSLPRCLMIVDNTEVLTDERHQELYHFVQQVPMSTSVLLTSRERGRASELETVIKLFGMSSEEGMVFMLNVCQARGMLPGESDLRYIYEATSGVPSAMRIAIGLMTEGYIPQEAVWSDIGRIEEMLEFLLEEAYDKLTVTEKKILHIMPIFLGPAPSSIISAASSVEGSHLRVALNRLRTLFLLKEHEALRYAILAPTRFFLLRRIHEAIVLLEPAPEWGALETPYRNLADGYQKVIGDLDRKEAGRFIRDQLDNLLAVMGWCYDHQEPALPGLLDLTGNWLGLWGYKRERVQWGELAVKLLRQEAGDIGAAAWHLVYNVGWTHFQQGHPQRARECFRDGLELAGVNHLRVQGVALRNLAQIAREYDKDFAEAKRLYLEALPIFQQLGDKRWIAICKGGLGVLALLQGDIAQAERYLADARTLNEQLDEIEGLVSNISDQAQLALEQGDLAEAEALLSRSTRLAQESELPEEEAYAKVWLARVRERQKRLGEASELALQAYQIYERVGLRTPVVGEVEQLRDRLQLREHRSGD
jgi:tetratricopeptide (TPR) repeat protein